MASTYPATTRLNAGVDWFTATSDKNRVGYQWFDYFKEQARCAGYQEEWRNRFYSHGLKTDGMQWGQSTTQGYILVVTGSVANEWWPRIAPSARRVSRLDLQVSAEVARPRPRMLEAYTGAVAAVSGLLTTHWKSSRGGQTLYCGSMHSEQFGRVYDRGREQNLSEAGKLWRYEVVLRNVRAMKTSGQLLYHTGDSAAQIIKDYVHQWFRVRGVRPLFAGGNDQHIDTEIGRTITTPDKKLQWLRSQVAPTVAFLDSIGRGDDARRALFGDDDGPLG